MSAQRARAWGEEMREVHRRLIAALDLARGSVEDEHSADALATDPLLYCWGFCTALGGHHRSEDEALFPRLAEQHPDLAPVIAQLVQDHNMIEHLIGGLRRAMEQRAPTEEKLRHLDGIEALMQSHFRFEERRLLHVLDSLSDETVSATDLYGPLA